MNAAKNLTLSACGEVSVTTRMPGRRKESKFELESWKNTLFPDVIVSIYSDSSGSVSKVRPSHASHCIHILYCFRGSVASAWGMRCEMV